MLLRSNIIVLIGYPFWKTKKRKRVKLIFENYEKKKVIIKQRV
jgi:hypothetical protein